MKKQIAITAAAILIIGLSSASAQAGSARRHTMEGILIGTGVTLLGTAIINSMHHPGPVVVKSGPYCPPRPHHTRYHKKHRRDHWKTRKIWIDPIYERRWNPGHYNKRGRWVPGRYQRFLVSEGHWAKKQVRVKRHHRRL